MFLQTQIQSRSFQHWIWNENKNKFLFWICGIIVILEFAVFKLLYPYPNFITDSHTYLLAAINNQSISKFPIGYSKFIRLFSGLTSSHIALILFQYVLLQASIFYFQMSVAFLLNLKQWIYKPLLVLSVLNPLLPYISNLISADSIFTSLSIFWFTQLLWVLYRPTSRLLLFHSFTLLLTFSMRYNALYYPIISLSIIVIARLPIKTKVISISCIGVLLSTYLLSTSFEYKKLTGNLSFIPAAGWQIAGNALAAYEQSPTGWPEEHIPDRYMELHSAITRHIDSTNPILRYFHRDLSYSYQFEQSSPLYTFMHYRLLKDSTTTPLKQWAIMAELYGDYGLHLVKQRPGDFLKHFVLPNLRYFYTPRKEFLEKYNMGKDTIDHISMYWFGLKSNKSPVTNRALQNVIAEFFQVISAISNLVFILGLVGTCLLGGLSTMGNYATVVFRTTLLLWITNFTFSIFTAPIVLRHQIFPMIISYTFGGILIIYIIMEAKSTSTEEFSVEEKGYPGKAITTTLINKIK